MKHTTSKLLIAGLSLTIVLFFTASFIQPNNSGKYLTLRTMESLGTGSTMFIIYEDGKTEEINLEKAVAKNYLPNTLKINQTINGLENKGYSLLHVSGGDIITNYIFVKK